MTQMQKEEVHHGGIRPRQDERAHLSERRSDRRKDVDGFAHHLGGSSGPDQRRRPTAFRTRDPSKAPFVLSHDQDGPLVVGWAGRDSGLHLRGKGF
jgi:hypothetical protein